MVDYTFEADNIASSEASKQASCLNNLFGDLGVIPTIEEPTERFCDNERSWKVQRTKRSWKVQAYQKEESLYQT